MQRSLVLAALLSLAAAPALAEAPAKAAKAHDHAPPPAPTNPDFARLVALAGDWTPVADPKTIAVTYRVTGGGAAVVETLFPGTPHEMMTVYTVEGSDVVLTHYCAARNQPRMKQVKPGKPLEDELLFTFTGGHGINPEKDTHMHDARIRFTGPDTLHSEWTSWSGGKGEEPHVFDLVRKKG